MVSERFTYHILDEEDWIVDHQNNYEFDLCADSGQDICDMLNRLECEKRYWKAIAQNRRLIE